MSTREQRSGTSRHCSEFLGEPLYQQVDGKRKVWRMMPTARRQAITLSTSQMVALFPLRRVFDFLAGTGFKEDLDDVFDKLEAMLKRKDFVTVRNFNRKVYDVNEARHLYEDRIEDVNDIMTAFLSEDRLRVGFEGVSGGRKTFVLEPYTLLVQEGPLPRRFSHRHRRSAHSHLMGSARSSGSRATTSTTRQSIAPSS